MRIALPENAESGANILDAANYHAPDIVAAGNAFAYSIYQHSKLSLRVFESARMATAVINGCLLCKNFRAARDVGQLGVSEGVITNGPVPDEEFYQSILDDDLETLNADEILAVKYAKAMGTDPQGLAANDSFWKEFKAEFDDAQVTDLTYCIAAWMGMGRVAHVLGLDVACLTPNSPEQAA